MATYTLTCPDPECDTTFDVELSPEDLADGADTIKCPECGEEWEWEHDPETDTLELIDDSSDSDDDESLDDDPSEDE